MSRNLYLDDLASCFFYYQVIFLLTDSCHSHGHAKEYQTFATISGALAFDISKSNGVKKVEREIFFSNLLARGDGMDSCLRGMQFTRSI